MLQRLILLWLVLLNLAGFAAGLTAGTVFRFESGMRRALTLEVGMQNAGAGVALAARLFGPQSPALVPCVLYTFGCMFTGTVLATWWHWRTVAAPSEDADHADQRV